MKKEATYTTNILQQYKNIAKENVSQKVSFFKQNEASLASVPLNVKLEIVLDYQMALFEIGHYNEYLFRCDSVIDSLFDSTLFPNFSKEIVEDLLFHKAGCQLNLLQLSDSQKTMQVLIKMDPKKNHLYEGLLFQIFKTQRLLLKFQARGIVIAMILCSAILSIWTAIFIKPIYPESLLSFQAWTIGLLVTGVSIWIGFMMYNNIKAYTEVNAFVQKCKK